MADEPLPSALSERDHQRLFWHEIAPLYFPEGLGRAAAPTAAFLGGGSPARAGPGCCMRSPPS